MRNASETLELERALTGARWLTAARVIALLALAAVLVVFPQTTKVGYLLSTGVVILNYAVTATGWNFMGGFTGYISLGHAAYFGLGAYGTGILVVKAGVSPFLALALAALIVAVIAVPIGIAALRVRGASFVIVTIAFVLILLLMFQSMGSITGGSGGLSLPRPFPDLIRTDHHRTFYYIYLGLLAVMLLAWWAIDRSRFGMGLKAVREDEDKARSLGVPTTGAKLVAFILSAFFTGLGGGLYALWFGDLDPVFQFSIMMGAYMVLMSLLGGVRSLFGPLLGALVVGIAIEFFKAQYGDTQFHLVATGLLLAVVVLFMPEGVIPAVKGLFARFGPQASSIREISAADLAAERDAEEASKP
ncbi:branched-chain amino acid ABC transporter permease [Occultella aeris]|uniref:High-affinity branched-chain amino acid transport system permease protein LivH n=1 Tax=Occultella aeris TaxID=2761496 RepID=A0A7M4DJ38_9MICO|nr:branched-chain amino acid ABC transporter permease [Occultella aeris]VZO37021.1 High-affinity branched-chain amino acid transport system permease protein LivH [Occultella aeris]